MVKPRPALATLLALACVGCQRETNVEQRRLISDRPSGQLIVAEFPADGVIEPRDLLVPIQASLVMPEDGGSPSLMMKHSDPMASFIGPLSLIPASQGYSLVVGDPPFESNPHADVIAGPGASLADCHTVAASYFSSFARQIQDELD